MKITAIKPQVKHIGRYSIYVDGKFAFGLGESDLLRLGIRPNQDITDKQLAEYKQESDLGKLYDKTLNLLSFRSRSSWELRDYLKRKKQSPDKIEEILNRLSKAGYVDDKKFAERWVESRRLLKPTSALKLKAELKQKRVADDIISEVLSADETDETEVLRQLVERKKSRYSDKIKFMQYLARQGFRYDDIKEVLAEY